jgi:hypothetical protein
VIGVPENARLRRFWFKFEGERSLGYGVTAWTEDDALNILRERVFESGAVPRFSVAADIDVSTLDAGHIRPNMENPTWRGIWFPRGFTELR